MRHISFMIPYTEDVQPKETDKWWKDLLQVAWDLNVIVMFTKIVNDDARPLFFGCMELHAKGEPEAVEQFFMKVVPAEFAHMMRKV